MRRTASSLSVIALLALAGCDKAVENETAAAALQPEQSVQQQAIAEIAWRKGDVLAAFTESADSSKPILLYWGAEWCPPCHRLRAGLFQEPDFIERTQDFIPVYLDGDTEGAQRWGEYFAIQGYPTIILLRPDKSEITRLSGSEEPDEIAQALHAAHASQTSAAELFARAQQTPAQLDANDWALLSAYGWEVNSSALIPATEKAALFHQLATLRFGGVAHRLFMLLALEDEANNEAPGYDAARQAEIRAMLDTVLANAEEVRHNRWPLIYSGPALIERAGGTADERKSLEAALIAALDLSFADESLPLVDRVLAINAEIDIHHRSAGADAPPPAALLEKVRTRAAWADATAQTPPERQSAIYYAAGLLEQVGDLDGAEKLLLGELDNSATPYYYMPSLADIAETRGDTTQALDWLRKGYESSAGPATRVQWGVLYADGVIRLTPDDLAAVETATARIIDELAEPDSYHQRTRGRFDQLGSALLEWSGKTDGASAVIEKLQQHMQQICAPAQSEEEARVACDKWLVEA